MLRTKFSINVYVFREKRSMSAELLGTPFPPITYLFRKVACLHASRMISTRGLSEP